MENGGIDRAAEGRKEELNRVDHAFRDAANAASLHVPRRLSIIHHPTLSILCHLVLILIVLVSGWWRAVNLDAFGIANDEGTHLMWAKLANEGYPLYSQTRAVQGPLFINLIQLSFRVLGTQVAAGRWVEICLGIVTLFGVGLLTRRLRGWTAAWAAAVALSVAPLFFLYSRIVRGDVAASAFLVLALISAYTFRRSGRPAWLGLSGLLLSVNLLVKAISPLAFTLILLLILQRRLPGIRETTNRQESLNTARQTLGDLLSFGLGFILPIAACFVIYDPAGLYDALVTFRIELRSTRLWDAGANLVEILSFLRRNAALAALAIYGFLSLLRAKTAPNGHNAFAPYRQPEVNVQQRGRGRYHDAAFMGLWLTITFITLLGHTPLFTHHLISLLVPMAVLAGVGVGEAVQRLMRWRSKGPRWPVWGLVGLVLIGFYAASLPTWLAADQHARQEITGGREADAIKLLRTVTAPGSFIISDNQMLPFMADRLSPPPLGDIALVAIQSGRQTTDRLIGLSRDYQAEAVISWSLRLPWLPEYLNWAEENYLVQRKWDDFHIIYFGRRMQGDQVPNRVDAEVGDKIRLLGYEIEGDDQETGSRQSRIQGEAQTVDVTLYWQVVAPIEEDYTVFVHLLNPDGNLTTQHDGQPLHGYLPTSSWSPGEVIPDHHRLPLAGDLSSGPYRLIAGMYLLETLERLPVLSENTQGTGDSVMLAQLELEDLGLEARD
jgi:hypothetical protein